MQEFMSTIMPEVFYTLCGLVCLDASFRAFTKNEEARIGTSLFWLLVGCIFIFGKLMPSEVTGVILVIMGCLTVTKQVRMGSFTEVSSDVKEKESRKIGNKIFIPAVSVGVLALAFSFVKVSENGLVFALPSSKAGVSLDGAVMVGLACILSLLFACCITKPSIKETRENTTKQLMQVGAACLLPQLLGALGSLFTEAGVGDVISSMISAVVPSGNIVIGVIIYCLGMVIFTMIMGNAFAAFSVITLGIGIPFVIAQGGDPVIVGTLGMTCGFCGTLLTPMAANFNIVPSAVLETRNKWTVIRAQIPMALILIVVHMVLMLVWAF